MKILSLFALCGFVLTALLSPIWGILPGSEARFGDKLYLIGGDRLLNAEDVSDKDLVVLFAKVEIAEGALISGDVLAFSSDIDLHGAVNGDIISVDSSIDLHRTAALDGSYKNWNLVGCVFLLPELR